MSEGNVPLLTAGDSAPDFQLASGSGNTIRLREFRGRRVVLFFYPKDDTPTCTKEACSFQDHLGAILKKGAVVLGINADPPRTHARFSEKYGLRFPLLSDETREVMKAFGVWKQKTLFGRRYKGIERTTFILDESGIVTHIFRKVRVKRHLEDVLTALS
ncbi:MAG: thioredoxin-dependent thiol peroxidase [Ignavibacteriales bacterium]|nr:thioredoxin-dependent thiol peroxidase [Ignavibacteriales bacterium]